MVSFLDKIKGNNYSDDEVDNKKERKEKKKPDGFLQLEVDIFETSNKIVVIAPVPGVEVGDLEIAVENENDVITIQGKKCLPAEIEENREKQYLRQECHWGNFFRQIILPQEINVNEVEAKIEKGILTLTLPLLRIQSRGKKKILIIDADEAAHEHEKRKKV